MLYALFTRIDTWFWGCGALTLIMLLGCFLTYKSQCLQIRKLPSIITLFVRYMRPLDSVGVHPLKVLFAASGGVLGIGNIVGVVSALQLGGPGALFWVWFAGIIGSIVKYAEIYIGMQYREMNEQGGFEGGPMYWLKTAFSIKWLPYIAAILLCIYGAEIYQFSIITTTVAHNWHIPKWMVISLLIILVLYTAQGGVQRLGTWCGYVIPFLLVLYLMMTLWIIFHRIEDLLPLLGEVLKSAFTGHGAIGGFAGSTLWITMQQGIARASYSADIGTGYDAIIQSASKIEQAEEQAQLSILGVLMNILVCTMSLLVVLLSGTWSLQVDASELIQHTLSLHFPFMHLFMPILFIIVGFTTLVSFFTMGIKCARFISSVRGPQYYLIYAISVFILFSFVPQRHALLVMSLSGAMLLIINLLAIYKLRHEILFPCVMRREMTA